MKKYWILLEPYTFIWSTVDRILIYNTLSKKSFLTPNGELLNNIVCALKDKENLYCVEIDEDMLCEHTLGNFITILRNSYSGDVISQDVCKSKPLVVYPSLNINEDINRKSEYISGKEKLGRKILNNLMSLDIYLGGNCSYQCTYCDGRYKQMHWCKSFTDSLPYDKIQKALTEIRDLTFVSVNIFGEIFSYESMDELLENLSNCSFNTTFLFDYKYFIFYKTKIDYLLNFGFNIGVLIGDKEWVNQSYFNSCIDNNNIEYIFSVESEEEFAFVDYYISKYNLFNVSIYPYYNGDNKNFFIKNVFQKEIDILSDQLDKREIFMRQTLNSNFFGKLIILPNGDILPHVNAKAIGSIESGIKDAIEEEILNGNFWLLTRRKVEPCMNCLYKDLCSPISNYEITMERMNLCYVEF